MRKVIIIAVDIFLTLLGTSNSNINEVEVLAAYTYYSWYIYKCMRKATFLNIFFTHWKWILRSHKYILFHGGPFLWNAKSLFI